MILKFIHILNICTILLSTVGIPSYKHYCQDQLKFISFFANLIEPCCKVKPHQNKPTQNSCCTKKDGCKITETATKNCFSIQHEKNKTSFQKKACCQDKSSYAQSDILSPIVADDNLIFAAPAILPTPISILVYTHRSYSKQEIYSPVIYPKLGFCPPPNNTPLYILHESFLC